jgi:hypothetical protein
MLLVGLISQFALIVLLSIVNSCLYQNMFDTTQDIVIVSSIGKLFFIQRDKIRFLLSSKLVDMFVVMSHLMSVKSLTKKFNNDILRMFRVMTPPP